MIGVLRWVKVWLTHFLVLVVVTQSVHCFTHLFTEASNNSRSTACPQFSMVPLTKSQGITAFLGFPSPRILSPLGNHL